MLMRGDRTVKRGGHGPGSTRLSTRQSVRADVMRRSIGIRPIHDDHGLALAPERQARRGVFAAGHIRDTGLAFPPVLMRGAKVPYGCQKLGSADISHVPGFVP